MQKIKATYAIFLLILVVITSRPAFAHLPDLGSEYRATLSVSDEKIIGETWMQQLRAAGMVYHDQIVNEYVQHLGNRLTPFVEMPYSDIRIKFFAVNDKSINAFAFFGGHIAVHSGMILMSKSESELAGVMSHELGHISQQHILRQITENERMVPILIAESLAAAVLGVPDLVIPILAGHTQHMLNFSRQHEQEADRIGMQILARAKFDPQGLPSIFERMSLSSRYQNKPPEYMLTHPLYESRISDTRHRASMFIYKQRPDSSMFNLIKARLEVQHTNNLQLLITEYESQLKSKRYENELVAKYTYAYALQQIGKSQQAWQEISPLAETYYDDLIIQMTAANIEFDLHKHSAAIARLEKLRLMYPDSYSLALNYVDLLLQTKQPAQAKKVLNEYKTMHPLEPVYYEYARHTESMLGNQAGVYEANAEWYVLNGDPKLATEQLNLALALKNVDKKTKARVEARIKAIDDLQKKIKKI